MKDEGSLILNLLALWVELPDSARRAGRIIAALTAATAASVFVSWGIVAFVNWQANPGSWSDDGRFAAVVIWLFSQWGATTAALILTAYE